MGTTTLLKTKREDYDAFGVNVRTTDGREYAYPDVSASRRDAERLLLRFLSDDISPIHYNDIARDYIIELAYERLERNGLA